MSFFTDIAKLATFLAYLVFLSFLDKEFVYFFLPTREKRLQYFQSRQPQIYGLFSSWRIVCSNTLWLPSPPRIYVASWVRRSFGVLSCRWGGRPSPFPGVFLGSRLHVTLTALHKCHALCQFTVFEVRLRLCKGPWQVQDYRVPRIHQRGHLCWRWIWSCLWRHE